MDDQSIINKRNVEALYAAFKHEQEKRYELERRFADLAEQVTMLNNRVQDMTVQIAMLRVKSIGTGATSG